MADGMFGITSVPVSWTLLYFTSAVPGGYSTWEDTLTVDGNGDPIYSLWGSVTVDTMGAYNTFAFTSAITVTSPALFISNGDPNGGNVGRIVDSFSYAFTTASSVSPYVTGAPVLAAIAGDADVDLSWSASATVGVDARMELIYRVVRNTVSPPFTVIDVDTVLLYDDTAVSNGVTYYYRVSSDIRVVGDTSDGLAQGKSSNIASAQPSASGALLISLSGVKGHRT